MKEQKVKVVLDSYEQGLMINGLLDFRNSLAKDNRPVEDINDLILKVIDAPADKKRWIGDRDDR